MNDDTSPSANFAELARHFSALAPHVNDHISPQEVMPCTHQPHYFCVGEGAVRLLRLALLVSAKPPSDLHHIIDMPCGHGRVMRAIAAEFPHAHLTACDLLRDGVDFCAATFHATPVYSEVNPKVQLFPDAGRYDLIFVGSLFTHLDAPRWPEFLKLFHDLLAPEGLLVFTTHGPFVAYRMSVGNDYGYGQHTALTQHRGLSPKLRPAGDTPPPQRPATTLPPESPIHDILHEYAESGFGYLDDGTGYGISLCRPSWVLGQVESIPGFRVLYHLERGWDNHQDAVALVKRPFTTPDTIGDHPFRSYITNEKHHPCVGPAPSPK